MHLERIHFDEIFDVVMPRSAFSFKSGGRVRYGASLGHRVVPDEGSTFAVVFAQQDNWTTVLGWRDLRSDTATLKYPVQWWSALSELSNVFLLSPAFFAAGLFFGGLAPAFVAALVPVGVACYKLYCQTQLNRQVQCELLSLDCQDGL
jgi:hypothetical protein